MDKPYDLKVLGSKLKERGVDVAEEAVKVLVEELFNWVDESAKLSINPYDDVVALVLPKLRDAALSQVDKIDGKIGE